MKVLVRGAGDLASAVIHKLRRSGIKVVATDRPLPSCVRRTVSFCNAIVEGRWEVDGITGRYISDLTEIDKTLADGEIPILTLPEAEVLDFYKPDVFVDATVSKRKADYDRNYAPLVIGLGPNIVAGRDADVVIETKRGHYLGSLIYENMAIENSGIPGNIAGFSRERVFRSPCDGRLSHIREIGDMVEKGDPVCRVGEEIVTATISGVIRGMIAEGYMATEGLKIGDIDPRGEYDHCFTISDKGRTIAGGVLEAILHFRSKEGFLDL